LLDSLLQEIPERRPPSEVLYSTLTYHPESTNPASNQTEEEHINS